MSKAFTSEETADSSVEGRPAVVAPAGTRRPITAEGHAKAIARRDALEGSGGHAFALASALLASVEVVMTNSDTSQVRFGHWVHVRLAHSERWFRVVGPDEAELPAGLLPVSSPLGSALLGLHVADTFELERPRGIELGEVLAIELTRPS